MGTSESCGVTCDGLVSCQSSLVPMKPDINTGLMSRIGSGQTLLLLYNICHTSSGFFVHTCRERLGRYQEDARIPDPRQRLQEIQVGKQFVFILRLLEIEILCPLL